MFVSGIPGIPGIQGSQGPQPCHRRCAKTGRGTRAHRPFSFGHQVVKIGVLTSGNQQETWNYTGYIRDIIYIGYMGYIYIKGDILNIWNM